MAINSDKKSTTPNAKKTGGGGGGAKFFAAYMRREGPKAPGSKLIPIGKPNCFNGLKFLNTGVLESTDRSDFERIVKQYGGAIVSSVTKKLDYLVVGNDPGHAKIKSAEELKVKQINEDEFLQLIITKSGITKPKYEGMEDMEMDMCENDENAQKESNIPAEKNSSSSGKLKKLLVDSDDEEPVRSEPKKEQKSPEKKQAVCF
jgi:replication factor C subunit 1